jgi:trehalose/maltose transport system permease protein
VAREIDLYERQRRLAWFLIVPAVLVVLLIVGYPLIQVFVLSFQNARLDGSIPATFAGFSNYLYLLNDQEFIASFWNTLRFTFWSVLIESVLGLVIALVANSKFRGRSFLRVAILVPWAVPTVVSAQMWKWMYNDVYGAINLVAGQLGLPKLAWIANPDTAMWAVIAIDVWKTTPFMTLMLLAGLQLIPGDLYEAASIDGANWWKQFWKVTFPLLLPTFLVALIFRTLDALRIFDLVYVLTGGGVNTETMAVYNRRQLIEFQDSGLGSAVSVVILIIIMVFVIFYTRFSKTSFK